MIMVVKRKVQSWYNAILCLILSPRGPLRFPSRAVRGSQAVGATYAISLFSTYSTIDQES